MGGIEEMPDCRPTQQHPDSRTTHWFAMKVFFDRTREAARDIAECVSETYIPTHTVTLRKNGRLVKVRRPAIASLLFIRTTPHQAEQAEEILSQRAMLYRLAPDDNSGQRRPAPIDNEEMRMFRLIVDSDAEGLEFIPDMAEKFRTGRPVRVIAGPFTGAEGRIVRLRGDRRLVVSLRGICAVATAYLPASFLEPIPDSNPSTP